MKNNFFKSTAAALAGSALLLNVGCSKLEDFGDTNQNPLVSTSPITGALLTNVESQLGALAQSVRPSLYVQYIAESQYTDVSLYQEPKLDFDGTYTGPLYDLQSIIDRNSNATASSNLGSGSNANQIAVAKILKSYLVSTVTDRWGDVPYTEALKGAANFFPKYDTQEEIYNQMFIDLKSAVDGFDGGLTARGDIFYNGDVASWKKLANTLRMIYAVRLSEKAPAKAAAEFAAAVADPAGFITTNAENLVSNYPGGAAYRHPWYDLYNGRSDYGFSKTLSDILNNMGDTRRTAYSGPGAAFPYGVTRDQAVAFTNANPTYALVLAPSKRLESSPVVIVNAATSLLTYAEGIERGWGAAIGAFPTAKSAYDAGIAASFEQWGVAGGAAYAASAAANYETGTGGGTGVGVNTYGSIPASSNAVTDTKLERIWLQKYLALYLDGIQAWSEFRRTGFPELKPSTFATNATAGGIIPTRYVYGPAQYAAAPAQIAEAVGRITGGDVMNGKVWWDL